MIYYNLTYNNTDNNDKPDDTLDRGGAQQTLAQDKGGPSKGGFLNNLIFSYTDLYSCNEINGMCIYR